MHLYLHIHYNKQIVKRRLDYRRIIIHRGKDGLSHTLTLNLNSRPSPTGTISSCKCLIFMHWMHLVNHTTICFPWMLLSFSLHNVPHLTHPSSPQEEQLSPSPKHTACNSLVHRSYSCTSHCLLGLLVVWLQLYTLSSTPAEDNCSIFVSGMNAHAWACKMPTGI